MAAAERDHVLGADDAVDGRHGRAAGHGHRAIAGGVPCDDGRIVARCAGDRGRPVAEARRPVDLEGEWHAGHCPSTAVADMQAHIAGARDGVVLQFRRHCLRYELRRFGEQFVHPLEQPRVLPQCLAVRAPPRAAGRVIERVMHDDRERRLCVIAVVHMLVFAQQCRDSPVLQRIGQWRDRVDPQARGSGLLDAVVSSACRIVSDRANPIGGTVVCIEEIVLGFGRGQCFARRGHRRTPWRRQGQCHRHAGRQCREEPPVQRFRWPGLLCAICRHDDPSVAPLPDPWAARSVAGPDACAIEHGTAALGTKAGRGGVVGRPKESRNVDTVWCGGANNPST